jgi:hypothetical protein
MAKSTPLARTPQKKIDDTKAISFVSKAGKPTEEAYPWEDANERVMKGIHLRLDEPTWAKLRYIADNTPFSIQRFIRHHLDPAIEQAIEELVE